MTQNHDSHTGRDRGSKGGDPEQRSQNGTGNPVLHGHALSWSISTPWDSFPVFKWHCCRMCLVFHLNNPYMYVCSVYVNMGQPALLVAIKMTVLVNRFYLLYNLCPYMSKLMNLWHSLDQYYPMSVNHGP
jgi:hypothetical protein